MNRATGLLFDYGYVARARARSMRDGMRPPELDDGDRAPVLLIPGVFETWHYLWPIARRLHALGHPVYFVEDLGFNSRAIDESATLVQRFLREKHLTGVIIVAHSKGGLIGKQLMGVDDTEGRVRRMIAVNTPFSGSTLAKYALGKAMREFHPEHRSVLSLSRDPRVNARITSIFSEYDQYIPGGSALAGADNRRLPLVGHFRPLGHPLLIDEVVARVADAEKAEKAQDEKAQHEQAEQAEDEKAQDEAS